MPSFDVNPIDPDKNKRPFVHMESAGDVTKQSALNSYAEQGPKGKAGMSLLANKLIGMRKKREAQTRGNQNTALSRK